MTLAESITRFLLKLESLLKDPGFKPQEIGLQLATLIYLRWADFQEAESEAIAAFDETEYSPVLPPSLHWRTWHAYEPREISDTLCQRLPRVLAALSNDRHNPLATHLHRLVAPLERFSSWSPETLSVVVRWLANQPFETTTDRRQLLHIFDQMMLRIVRSDRHTFGEYFEPAWIAELVAALGRPVTGDRIYDPCFGLAGFLVAACDHMQTNTDDGFRRSGVPELSVSGMEINANAFVIGLTRLALAGMDEPQLEIGNSLERTANRNPHSEGYDIVFANPPWGARVNVHGLDHYPIKTNDSVVLFIQNALTQLHPEGRAVIVVPQGMLYRGGAVQRLRELLMEQHSVEAVINLPMGSYEPYTAIATGIILLRRKSGTQRVRMVDAERLLSGTRKGEAPTSEQIRDFVKLVQSDRVTDHAWFASVDEISKADWDLTPKRRDQSGLEAALEHLRQHAPMVKLSECCDIFAGRSIRSDDLLKEPRAGITETFDSPNDRLSDNAVSWGHPAVPEIDPVAYIRVSDLQKGVASKGTRWLGPAAMHNLDVRRKLKAGDILLSKSGTIGKVAIVRNGAVGAVPSHGLLVLRQTDESLDPHFLIAYLASAECQAWLLSRARGTTISHLSQKLLSELPVPLPPIQVQQRTAEQHREHGVDALAYLTQLLIGGERDPIITWLDQALQHLQSERAGKLHDLTPLRHAHVFGDSFAALCNELARSVSGHDLAKWVQTLNAVVAPPFLKSEAVPQGTALYALLQQAQYGLSQALNAIEGHLPHANRARELTQLVDDRVRAALTNLLDDVELQVTASTANMEPNSINECTLNVANRSALSLQAVEVTISPWSLLTSIGFMTEGQQQELQISGQTPPSQGGQFDLTVNWTGIRLDGKTCEGSREITFKLVDTDTSFRPDADFGASPYICGDPITPQRGDMFVGRDGVLAQIHRQIADTGNVVLLEGNRRSGKTSILKHLDGPNAIPGWLGVYASLQGAEGRRDGVGVPTDEVFRTLARELAKSVHALGGETPLPNGSTLLPRAKPLTVPRACREGISTEAPFADFQAYLEVLLDFVAERDLGLLLLLDEFDKLQEGIDNGVTSPQVPENIRFLVQTYPRFTAILTGSKRLRRLREEYWSALYGLGTRIGVTALDEAAAEQLITLPVKGQLTYTKESIRRVIHLTAGQPYLLQCLCNRIYEQAVQLKAHSVTLDQVDNASLGLVDDNEHFASLWDYAGGEERPQLRRYLLALCHHEGNSSTPLRLGAIQERLLAEGIEVDDTDVIADLDHLRELELIDFAGDGISAQYRLSIPLMGLWVDRQRDIEATLTSARIESEDHHE